MTVQSPAERFDANHALVIAVDQYGDGIPPLRNAVRDGLVVGRALGAQQGFTVQALFDRDATCSSVRQLLAELPARIRPGDRLCLYIACHGILGDDQPRPTGYLLLQDARPDSKDTYLPMREVYAALALVKVRHVLLVLDCCFAGAFRWATFRDVGVRQPMFLETYDRFVTSPARQVLTSAAGDQRAFDAFGDRGGDALHSPFARALLRGLGAMCFDDTADVQDKAKADEKGADLDGDGIVSATELYWYVRRHVEHATAGLALQSPGLFPLDEDHQRGEFVFRLPAHPIELNPAPELNEDENPYLGLVSHTDPERFFGRRHVTLRLAKRVRSRPLTILVGPSGCGKSSLLAAGLAPIFKNHRRRGWRVHLVRTLDAIRDGIPGPEERAVLVLDQFEDLVTQGVSEGAKQALVQRLASWLACRQARVVLALRSDFEPLVPFEAIASDWRDARIVVPPMTQDQLRQVILGPASTCELVYEPAQIVDDLVNEVVQMPGALPLLSVTLSELYRARFARVRLARDPADRAIRADDVKTVGGVMGALTRRATVELQTLIAEDGAYGEVARRVMLRMVDLSGGEVVRRRVYAEELFEDGKRDRVSEDGKRDRVSQDEKRERVSEDEKRVKKLLERFLAARLLVGDVKIHVEPAHDGLVRGWTRLAEWVQAETANLPVLRALAGATQSWTKQQRPGNLLWDGDPRLGQVRALARATPTLLNAAEREFVAASTRKKYLILAMIAAITVAVLIALSILYLAERAATKQADQELGRIELETARRLLINEQRPMSALPYLVDARSHGVESAMSRLLFGQARRSLPPQIIGRGAFAGAFLPHGDRVILLTEEGLRIQGLPPAPPSKATALGTILDVGEPIAMAPDGSRIAVSSHGGVRMVDSAGVEQPALPHDGRVWQLAFETSGARLATTDEGGRVRVWDLAAHTSIPIPVPHRATGAWFAPDLPWLAIAWHDPDLAGGMGGAVGIELWDLTGHPTRRWCHAMPDEPNAELPHERVHFSADGQRLLLITRARIASWTTADGAALIEPRFGSADVVDARFDAQGVYLVEAYVDGAVQVRDLRNDLVRSLPQPTRIDALAMSPDGGTFAAAGSDGRIYIRDTRTGTLVAALEDQHAAVALAFSPDGNRLLVIGNDEVARLWPIVRWFRDKDERERVGGLQFDTRAVLDRSIEARLEVDRESSVRLFDLASGLEVSWVLTSRDGRVEVAFSSDETRLYTRSQGTEEKSPELVWDIPRDQGSLQDWKDAVARCGTLRLDAGKLIPNEPGACVSAQADDWSRAATRTNLLAAAISRLAAAPDVAAALARAIPREGKKDLGDIVGRIASIAAGHPDPETGKAASTTDLQDLARLSWRLGLTVPEPDSPVFGTPAVALRLIDLAKQRTPPPEAKHELWLLQANVLLSAHRLEAAGDAVRSLLASSRGDARLQRVGNTLRWIIAFLGKRPPDAGVEDALLAAVAPPADAIGEDTLYDTRFAIEHVATTRTDERTACGELVDLVAAPTAETPGRLRSWFQSHATPASDVGR